MTVAELIKMLEKCNCPDEQVVFDCKEINTSVNINIPLDDDTSKQVELSSRYE